MKTASTRLHFPKKGNLKLIVDANIVFSAILNTNSKIADLLINSHQHITFIAPDFLRSEIYSNHSKLCKISGLTKAQIIESEFQVYKYINFISEAQIKPSAWRSAYKLTHDVDPKDTPYVAFAKHFRCKIWSGDKSLMKGLSKKGFSDFVTTNELFEWKSLR